jgi:predicted ArsR family transcriptional regulator
MSSPTGDWDVVELLAEPTRRRVLETVRGHDGPVTREAVADEAGIAERLAAFHLDRLAQAGLLDVDYARPAGRSGPGAGRPAKRYRPAPVQVNLTVPPRRYSLVARILARGMSRSRRDAASAARDAAYQEGRQLGEASRRPRRPTVRAVCETLASIGYEPHLQPRDKKVRLRNCPFHDVVEVNRELVCSLNHRFITGVIDGIGANGCQAQPDGQSPDCCVTVHTGK